MKQVDGATGRPIMMPEETFIGPGQSLLHVYLDRQIDSCRNCKIGCISFDFVGHRETYLLGWKKKVKHLVRLADGMSLMTASPRRTDPFAE